MKKSLRKKALIYLFYDRSEKSPIDWFREIMEMMSPDVIVVPEFTFTPQDHPEDLLRSLRPIASEYASRMDWGWEKN